MAADRNEVLGVISGFLLRIKKPAELSDDTPLYAEGIGLDSLETAELSATLEEEFDTDPFGDADMPHTVGDILAFYAGIVASEA
jgi:acyl carrier protein